MISSKTTSTPDGTGAAEALACALTAWPLAGSRGIEAVLDPVPGAWYFTRRDGSFAYVSLGACEWLGYSREEVRNLTIFDIDTDVALDEWHAMWGSNNPPDSLTLRRVHRHKDGTRSPVEVRAVRVYVDGEDLAVSYSVDLTQSEQTRAALVNTQAELERLINHLPDLVFRLGVRPQLGFIFVSPSCSSLLGYGAEELVGSEASVRRLVHPDDLGEFLSLTARAPGSGRRLRFQHASGHVVWMELRTTPLVSGDGQSAVIEGVARDITETHEREQRAAHLYQRQKLEALGQLAGGIAHDFNNLLQVIAGNTQLAKNQNVKPGIEPLLAGVMTAAERAASLIKQLLAFSRKGGVELTEVDLGQMLTSLVEMLERLMGEHIAVSCKRPSDSLFVRGNAAQLEQLIVNLCVNARDALPRGGNVVLELDLVAAGDLPASVERQLVRLAPSYARLSVRDDGDGMSLEVQSRMYEPFFTTKSPGKGTGLGLSTVYAVVQAHGGAIEVTSSPGKGSSFQVFVPSVASAPRRPSLPLEPARIAGGSRLALAAEDEPGVLQLTAGYLSRAGFRVITAKDGQQAAALIEQHGDELAVAVLDVVMPKRSGVDICERLRARGVRLPIVLVTGYDDEDIGTGVGDPRLCILKKPFGADDLLSRIALVLSDRPASKQVNEPDWAVQHRRL